MQRFEEPQFGHPWSVGSYIKSRETNEKYRQSHYFKSKQTSLLQQSWQKLYSLIGKYLTKISEKTACTLIKLAQSSATAKNFPHSTKKQPNCAGKPPNWQHCTAGPALAGAGPNARPRRGAPLSSGVIRHRAQSTVLMTFLLKIF